MIITINQREVHAPQAQELTTLVVLSGTVWLTEEGQAGDQLLFRGTTYSLVPGRKVVLQSLEENASYELGPCRGRLCRPAPQRALVNEKTILGASA